MKRLILVRHAKTEHQNYDKDFTRKLTNRGMNDARLIAEQLKNKNISPDYFICSTAVRAIQTTEIFADVFGYPKDKIEKQQFLYDGYTTTDFLHFISMLDNHYNTLLIVAHNPEIAMLASALSDESFYHFPTTATAVIDFETDMWERVEPRQGKVHMFLYPRIFKN
ncbi:MAG: phosphoglycerate mutase [Chlorobi bacterium]|nr:phosphoglycerate mutase [Chlorobiota bacterium]